MTGSTLLLLLLDGQAGPTPTLRRAIWRRLAESAELLALVDGDVNRITPGVVAEGAPLPAITYAVPSVNPARHLRGPAGVASARVQLDAWAEDPADAEAIQLAIARLFNGWSDRAGALYGIRVESSVKLDERDLPGTPRPDGSGEWTARISADYRIVHRTAIPNLY